MRGKFFMQPQLSFVNTVQACINKIKGVKVEDIPTKPEILACVRELKNCSQDHQFATINSGIKGEAEKILAKFEEFYPAKPTAAEPQAYVFQTPSQAQINKMKGMPAGGEEDQCKRLTHMVKTITEFQKEHSSLPIITSNQVKLAKEWQNLFAAIRKGSKVKALQYFKEIPATDIVLKALLAVHPQSYLQKIIVYCIDARRHGKKGLEDDIVITPQTFEILIHDIAATLMNQAKIQFSFGLPSHHAFNEKGSGFCVLNKTAVVLQHSVLTHSIPLKYVIVGTDVNRDNGLCQVLMDSASHLDIDHIDIFDSRVYPHQDSAYISKELGIKATDVEKQKIKCWSKEQLDYYAVDLSLTPRKTVTVHPALLFSIKKITETLEAAKKTKQKLFLLLPTGWDSHQNETAYCGKFVDGRVMEKSAAKETRFSDEDLTYFYENIFKLYTNNKEHFEGVYWGLEGGYDRTMYEKQIGLLLQVVTTQLVHQNSEDESHAMDLSP
jgi:acetoin utilization deacetylase AcuC-like enzyme